MDKYPTLTFIVLLTLLSSQNIVTYNLSIAVDEISVGETKNIVLNSTIEHLIIVNNLSNIILKVPPRISVRCDGCEKDHPLLIVVRKNKNVMSWVLPSVSKSESYKHTERTLCPFDITNGSSSLFMESQEDFDSFKATIHPITLSLSTSYDANITVELQINLVENFLIDLQSNKTVQVTPSTPSFYFFEFPPANTSSILLHVTSEDDTCLIVSIQNVSCPVFDLEENVKYRGHYQTITRQGGLTLTKEAFPFGFFVVLIVSREDKYCSSALMARSKTVVISVSETLSSDYYYIAVAVTFFGIFLFCCSVFIFYYFSFKREKDLPVVYEEEFRDGSEIEPSASASFYTQLHNAPETPGTPITPATSGNDVLSIRTDSSLDETDFDLLNDAELDKNIFRMKGLLYVCDLARKNQTVLKKKSELYFWNLLTVAIFYFLPVIQLVITNQFQLNQSGDEDLCYYNFLCSHPFWIFSDFNHVFSNIGYISLGILFMIVTAMKERVYKAKICSNKTLYRFYGIPQHFGLFYAMGAALIIEGIMSSCYHVCPNHYNFQFDSSFMYVICTLCVIKIYHTRHPDVNANANATFFLLAGVIFIGMYGVFSSNSAFWILFTIAHLSTCTYLSLQVYYVGRWRFEFRSFVRFFKELKQIGNCNFKFFVPMFPSRFFLLLAANACNWGLAVFSFVKEIKNFSSYFLAIFMMNLILYTAFYILMKFVCRERLSIQAIIYIALSILGWSSALYFFFNKTISWVLTPAESKLYNQKCMLLGFYDGHDIWHFISAAAMFFSFMVLLTLDDDLAYVHRSKIVVF